MEVDLGNDPSSKVQIEVEFKPDIRCVRRCIRDRDRDWHLDRGQMSLSPNAICLLPRKHTHRLGP